MVLLHFKKSDLNQFLYETTVNIPIEDLLKELVELNNLRIKLDRLCVAIEDLAKHGPLKPEELRGLEKYEEFKDDITTQNGLKKQPPRVGQMENADPAHHRTGWVLEEDKTSLMLKHVTECKLVIHRDRAIKKEPLTHKEILDCIDILRGVVQISYPAYHGLGDWEPARGMLELPDLQAFYNPEQLDTAVLWWAGKELMTGKLLKEYIGSNEKTKIMVKISKKSAGPPVREPLIDEKTHKAMLSYYHKKNEEHKKLELDEDDTYLNSKWANPKGMKNDLSGIKDVKFKQFIIND